jgi:uncharacterized membrane protein
VKVGKKLREYFFLGILVVMPIAVAILILAWIVTSIDNILQPVITSIMGNSIPGLGFIIMIIVFFLVGAMTSIIGGRRLINIGGILLGRIPVFSPIYTTIKKIFDIFSTNGKDGLRQVVLVEFPMKGARTLGFVTNESLNSTGEKLLHVYVPTAPNPTSGFLQIMKEENVTPTNLSIDDALKMILSAGKELPPEISRMLSAE